MDASFQSSRPSINPGTIQCFLENETRTDDILSSATPDRTIILSGQTMESVFLDANDFVVWYLWDQGNNVRVAASSHNVKRWLSGTFIDSQTITAHTGGTFLFQRRIYNDGHAKCFLAQVLLSYTSTGI